MITSCGYSVTFKFLLRFLDLDPVVSVTTLAALLYIADHPGVVAREISDVLNIAQPATVRHLQRLEDGSQGSSSVGKGLGLIYWVPDTRDARRRCYYLSDKGLEFLQADRSYIDRHHSR